MFTPTPPHWPQQICLRGNVFTYNAKAHPELGTSNTLLITYKINRFDTADVYRNVDSYRPRHIHVTFRPSH